MAIKNDITELRGILFGAMRALTDKENPMEIERARAVAELSQAVIASARVEVAFLRQSGQKSSDFLGIENGSEDPNVHRIGSGTVTKETENLPNGVVGITRHTTE